MARPMKWVGPPSRWAAPLRMPSEVSWLAVSVRATFESAASSFAPSGLRDGLPFVRGRPGVAARLDTLRAPGVYSGDYMGSHAPPSPDEMGDLLARVFAGDRRAARDLTEHVLLPLLDSAASRLLLGPRGQRFEKTDVIQEVFQHLYQDDWRRLRPYDAGKGSLAAYVWAIARSWVRDHARRLPPPRPVEDMETEISPDSGPERRAALGELISHLERDLTAEDLALFQWVYVEGASHTAAAARVGISVEAVHKRVQRLETKIRAIVSGEVQKGTEARGEP